MKFIYILFVCLGLTACTTYNNSQYGACDVIEDIECVPASVTGVFISSITNEQAKKVIAQACIKNHWTIVDVHNKEFTINFNAKGMNILASIQYTNKSYIINFNKIQYSERTLVSTYNYYDKLVDKLSITIQKLELKI